ncbi:MAG TPA: diacylglycerol kinase family protein [Coriobacteriia bacterium]|nr:diacylglycerol kinase family protein [Coriobacteriia bacterium]
MLGKTLLVVNPAARHGVTRELLPVIRSLLDRQLDYDLVVTDRPGHAIEAAATAHGYHAVVAVGGDGTVNEVLNGLMRIAREDRPALALLPTGSGNDYRRTLGISTELAASVRQLIGGVRESRDVGLVNETYFANSVAIGLDARVTAKAIELKATTGWSGLALYLRALLSILLRSYHSHQLRVSLDGGPAVDRDVLAVVATNGPTYGGGFWITPDARPDDGVLDTCVIDRVSLPGALVRLPFVVVGRHGWMRPVTLERHTSLRIESQLPVESQIDGEVTLASTYDISILPGGLDVIVPGRCR